MQKSYTQPLIFTGLFCTLVSLAYAPIFAFAFLPIFFLFLAGSNLERKLTIFVPFLALYFVSLLLVELSRAQLIFNNDDFVYYYNYFLDFIKQEGDARSYGGNVVIEPGLTALNYLFATFIGEQPYIYKAAHVILQTFLLFLCVVAIGKYYRLSVSAFILLFTLVLVFYEYGYSFHILRQGYASFFVVLAVFSRSKLSKLVFIVLATCFHITSVIVFPLVNFLIKNDDPGLRRKFVFMLIAGSGVLMVVLVLLSGLASSNPLLMKLLVAYYKFESIGSVLLLSFKNNLNVLLLFLFLFFVKQFSGKDVRYDNLIPIVAFMFTVGLFPSFNRLIYPISNILVGYLFYLYLCQKNKIINGHLFYLICFNLIVLRLILNDGLFFRFEPVGQNAFYYLESISESAGWHNRALMPRYSLELLEQYKN
ncbi:EpsG family protein [Vibrio owensii]|uniref:EpsG family protein n=1 Tax=Vibrio owensii TaxID=696485 RepID=UPI0033956A4F